MREQRRLRIFSKICFFFLAVILVFQNKTFAGPPQIDWIEGPSSVDLGVDLAQIYIPKGYLFANGKDTVELMKFMGNQPSKREVGAIFPNNDQEDWFILFDFMKSGYIKNDDREDIDADGLLEDMKSATEQSNKWRTKKGFPAINLVGWQQEPYYDIDTNNLTWATLVESEGLESANYNTRLLGRHGYMSVTLVASPGNLNSLKRKLDSTLRNFSYIEGKRYSEYMQGDKVAKYGLTALIAGGAGAAAVKYGLFGLLAKWWKVAVVAVIGFFSAIWGKIKSFFGGND